MFRILLVDDDPTLRQSLAAYLRHLGFGTPVQASDGLEGLSALDALPADLIITDCQMPNMDGLTFVRTLRSQGYSKPIIMLSGQGDPRVVQLAMGAGVSHYVEKPLNPPQLLGLIRRLSTDPTPAQAA